jgi:hypothetical protein
MVMSGEFNYSLRSILLFTNMDVSGHSLVLDTSIFATNNMDWWESVDFGSNETKYIQDINDGNKLIGK